MGVGRRWGGAVDGGGAIYGEGGAIDGGGAVDERLCMVLVSTL